MKMKSLIRIVFVLVFVSVISILNAQDLKIVAKNGKHGFKDRSGKVVIDYKFDYAFDFSEGLARVELDGKYGYINTNGDFVIPCQYRSATDYTNGRAYVEKNGKSFFINKPTNVVASGNEAKKEFGETIKLSKTKIQKAYDKKYDYHEGYALAIKDGKYGYIDHSDKIVISFQYENAANFSKGKAFVTKRGKDFYINKKGVKILETKPVVNTEKKEGKIIEIKEIKKEKAIGDNVVIEKTETASKSNVLYTAFFDHNSTYLDRNAKGIIEQAAEFLANNPNAKIELSGNLCKLSSDIYNKDLSIQRAQKISDILVNEYKISSDRIIVNKEISGEASDPNIPANRRVDFRIVK